MGHEGHHHEEKKPLSFFATPLNEHSHSTKAHNPPSIHSDVEAPKDPHTTTSVPFGNADCSLHDNPAYHRHAEATTSELFYDLFFVANLTTFTSMLEINDHNSLTAYIGFFSLLWLTWYQVSLYDVRFSTDSVFERVAKAIHFGVMVGFAVIGPQWKPGQAIGDYKIYKAFGLILMVSRITLFLQYAVTLFYSRKYTKTIVPLVIIMASTIVAAILYGALTPAFPDTVLGTEVNMYGYPLNKDQKSDVYIAWYVIGICETILTVAVSCIFRVISFKGTHMVQRMSLLTLIILGEGIIVVCKAISKIVKNDYLWTVNVVGQIIAAVLIIYFLYMLYFDRMQEEHFGSIKQQIWSFSHFPLHVVFVLVLQGVSLLIIWTQALNGMNDLINDLNQVNAGVELGNYMNGSEYSTAVMDAVVVNVYCCIPKGVDATEEINKVNFALVQIEEAYDFLIEDENNETAIIEFNTASNDIVAATVKTLFDNLSVSTPKKKKKTEDEETTKTVDVTYLFGEYVQVFELVFMYVFVSVSRPISIPSSTTLT